MRSRGKGRVYGVAKLLEKQTAHKNRLRQLPGAVNTAVGSDGHSVVAGLRPDAYTAVPVTASMAAQGS